MLSSLCLRSLGGFPRPAFGLLLALMLFAGSLLSPLQAQKNRVYRFKAEGLYGQEVHSTGSSGAVGGEVSLELPKLGNKNWHYTYNFPTVGFALGYINLLGTDSVSRVAYTYPYFLYPFVHTPVVALNVKMGMGLACFVDYAKNDHHQAIFPYANMYKGGLGIDIFLGRSYGNPLAQWQLCLGGDVTVFHDCFIDRETQVMIVPNVNLALKYTPNVYPLPMKHPAKPVRHWLALEAGLSGGVNQLSPEDDGTYYPCFDLDVGVFYPFSNAYRMGLGLDGFYNGAYNGKQRVDTRYNFIEGDKLKNKIRPGIYWANELTMDRFSGGVQVGFYPYNPIKVPSTDEKGRKLDNNMEDFLYFKFVTKYRVSRHIYISSYVKSHQQVVEMFGIGVGYYMRDFGRRLKNPFSRISFKKEDPDELKVEDGTMTKKPFRFNEAFDE